MEFAERTRASLALIVAYSANGLALLSNGRWKEAVDSFARSLETSSRTRAALVLDAFTLTGLARAHFALGEAESAFANAEKAARVCEHAGTQAWECAALLALAHIRRATGEPSKQAEIDASLRRIDLFIQDTGAKSYEPFLHVERAESARLTGDEAARQRELPEAHRLFTEIGAPIRAAEVARELAG